MKKFKSFLFIFGRILSVVLVLYYVIALLIVLFSGIHYQFIHNLNTVAIPFIAGTTALVVGYLSYFLVNFIKGRRAYKEFLEEEFLKKQETNNKIKTVFEDNKVIKNGEIEEVDIKETVKEELEVKEDLHDIEEVKDKLQIEKVQNKKRVQVKKSVVKDEVPVKEGLIAKKKLQVKKKKDSGDLIVSKPQGKKKSKTEDGN